MTRTDGKETRGGRPAGQRRLLDAVAPGWTRQAPPASRRPESAGDQPRPPVAPLPLPPSPTPSRRPPSRTELGRRGESLAARLLEKRGFVVLERNFRVRGGELDLICRAGDVLVFVEVRARRGDAFGLALESITHAKRLRMRHSARRWLNDRADRAAGVAAYRFDLVALEMDASGRCRAAEHVEDILA